LLITTSQVLVTELIPTVLLGLMLVLDSEEVLLEAGRNTTSLSISEETQEHGIQL